MNQPRLAIVDSDAETIDMLDALGRRCGFHCQAIRQLDPDSESFERQLGRRPALAFISGDENLDAVLRLITCDSLRHTEVVVTTYREPAGDLRREVEKAGSMLLAKPLDQAFIGDLMRDVHAELCRSDAAPHAHESMPTLNQCGLLRGNDRAMQHLYRLIRKVAPTRASVLVTGESGTGKELVAQTLHMLSGQDGPFLSVNCGAISSGLIESELFGHERGSFSGASRLHHGMFERAGGGTLFLDEITEMSPAAQVKLLRVLESGEFRRVGGEKTLTTSARIVAASNRDCLEAVRQGALRFDLYYRIAQFALELPPLRARSSDIIGLAYTFLRRLDEQTGSHTSLTRAAEDKLRDYSWPGNVRELKNVIEHAHIVSPGAIGPADLPLPGADPLANADYLRVAVGSSLADTDRRLIFATLAASEGDKRRAAELLGISLKTLYNRLNSYAQERSAESA